MISSRAVTLASVLARLVYGLDSVTTSPHGGVSGAMKSTDWGAIAGSCAWPGSGSVWRSAVNTRSGSRLDDRDAVGVRADEAELPPRCPPGRRPAAVSWNRSPSRISRAAGWRTTVPSGNSRIDDVVVGHRREHQLGEDAGRRVGSGRQALLLELAEVVVEAVDDDRRDEGEGQRDDAHERERQAGLERLRHRRPDLAPVLGARRPARVERLGPAAGGRGRGRRVRALRVGHVSARRTGSRRRGR